MSPTSGLRRRRPRSTPKERARWVRRYERSGLSQQEFARRHQLGLFTLRRWIARKALGTRTEDPPVWRELKVEALRGGTSWAVEVVRPDGLVVRLAHNAPPRVWEGLLGVRPC